MEKYIPNATRSVDPFHVVTWAMESLDTLRKDIWREHRDEAKDFAKAPHERKADQRLMIKIQPNSIN